MTFSYMWEFFQTTEWYETGMFGGNYIRERWLKHTHIHTHTQEHVVDISYFIFPQNRIWQENLPDRPTCCPSTVAYRCVILREYPPNGRWGSSVRVMGTEMLMGPESSSRRGTWVLERAWPLVTTMLSGVVDSFKPCFIVSFSDTQKSSSLKRSRKVFQSCKRVRVF